MYDNRKTDTQPDYRVTPSMSREDEMLMVHTMHKLNEIYSQQQGVLPPMSREDEILAAHITRKMNKLYEAEAAARNTLSCYS